MPALDTSSTLEGTLERVVFVNEENGWSVARLSVHGRGEPVTIVGNLFEVQPGERLRLTGSWEQDRKYGQQFRIATYRTILPTSAKAIERYLGSGLIRGIGKSMAKRLVEHFGDQTLDVIERYSGRLTEVPGIGPKRSQEIRQAWLEQHGIKQVMLFLQEHEVPTAHSLRIWKTYGTRSIEIVKENPYRLAADVFGIGFKTADAIAERLGVPRDSPQRAEAATLYLLGQAAERGHLFLPRGELLREGGGLLGIGEATVSDAIARLSEAGTIALEHTIEPLDGEADGPLVYSKVLHEAETALAARLVELSHAPIDAPDFDVERALTWFEGREKLALAAAQREAIARALTEKILVLTGGPGTGKTTLVRGVVAILEARDEDVLLAAPTGRAAKRLAEATGIEAKTIHRLLEFSPRTGQFERNAERPLEADLLIVDEVSMLDAPLARALVDALPDEARLMLVGDADQLPSVGPGNVLADLIRSGTVPVVRLTEIFRQAQQSSIVTNAHRIRDGVMPELSAPEGADFFFIERGEPEAALETLLELVAGRIPQRFGLDPMTDVQVLTPMNRGLLGVLNLNQALRERLNPTGREVLRGGRIYRLGDRVMQIRNNYELEVFNGDLGRITGIDDEKNEVAVDFDGKSLGYGFTDLDELVPAYACSIHKSQGSEYPCIVLPLHTQHYVMLERNLVYTALTRARKLAVLIGEKRALSVAVSNRRVRRRHTLLAERLRAAVPTSPVPAQP